MNRLLTVAALCLLTTPAFAGACLELSEAKKIVNDTHGQWVEMTKDQWAFMRGAFYANPKTEARLPYGDKAVLGIRGGEGGVVFFIDGDLACDMLMLNSRDALDILRDVGAGTITHEEKGP